MTNIAIRFPGPLKESVAFSAAQLQNLSGKASCTAIAATDKKSAAKGVCSKVPPVLGAGDLPDAGDFCDFDWKPIDQFTGAKALKNLTPLVYYAAVVVMGVGLMGLGLTGYAGRGPLG